VEKAIRDIRDKKARGDYDVPGHVLNYWKKMVSLMDTTEQQHI
jgi:hypothetical protein